jgi:hypothetical protein
MLCYRNRANKFTETKSLERGLLKRLTPQRVSPFFRKDLEGISCILRLCLGALKDSFRVTSRKGLLLASCQWTAYLSGATNLTFIGLPLIEYLEVPIWRRPHVSSKGRTCGAYSTAVLWVRGYMHESTVSNFPK